MKRSRKLILAAAVAASLRISPEAWGANASWTFTGSGSWGLSSNWQGGGLPNTGSTVFIVNTDGVGRTINLNVDTPLLGGTTINLTGSTSTSTLLISSSGNALDISGIETIGDTGRATVNQSAGRNAATTLNLGFASGGVGTYLLSGNGSLTTTASQNIGVSGRGTFSHSSGTNTFSDMNVGLNNGGLGTYLLSGTGSLTGSGTVYVGNDGTGRIFQTGGVHTAADMYLGYSSNGIGSYEISNTSTLSLSGGLHVGYGGIGTFEQSGNTPRVFAATLTVGDGGAGTYMFSTSGSLAVSAGEKIGTSGGVGYFYQFSGTHTVGSDLEVGTGGVGTYELNSIGTLAVTGKEFVGRSSGGAGTFMQSGGTHTISSGLTIAAGTGATGRFLLSGGSLAVSGDDENVGYSGLGTFVQTGGTHTISQSLYVGGFFSSGLGTYMLSNGVLAVTSSEHLGTIGAGTFIQSSGTHTVGSTLHIGESGGSDIYQFSGGALSAATIDVHGDPSRFNWTSGSTTLTGTGMTLAGGKLFGTSLTLDANRTLTVAGTTTVPTGTSLVLDDAVFTTGSLIVNSGGLFNFKSGTLKLTNSNLTIGSAGPMGTAVELDSNHHVELTGGSVIVDSAGVLYLSAGTLPASAGITNNGQVQVGNPAAQFSGGAFTNNGILSGTGRITNTLTNSASGTVRASGSEWLRFTGSTNTNNGQINLINGGAVEFTSALTNSSTGVISGRGVFYTGGSGLANSGNVALSAGVTDVHGDIANNSGGKIIVSGQGNVTFWDDVTNNAGGSIKVSPGSVATFFGTYAGGGITGGGDVYFESDITPGFSPAAIGITGNANFGNASKLKIELAGLTRGNQYDAIDISGTAELDGQLAVSTLGGFIPLPGDEFDVLSFGSRSGDVTILNQTGYAGLVFTKSYSASELTLITSAQYEGDANLDGKVDVQDLLRMLQHWQGSANWLGGDFTDDGLVNRADLGLMARNWQAGVPLGAALSSLGASPDFVPEPGGLCAFAALAWSIKRPRRRRF